MMLRAIAALLALATLASADPLDAEIDAPADAPVSAVQHRHHHHKHHHRHHRHHRHAHADEEEAVDTEALAAPIKVPAAAPQRSVESKANHTAASSDDKPVRRTVSHSRPVAAAVTGRSSSTVSGADLAARMHKLEGELEAKEAAAKAEPKVRRSLRVNGPLPADFAARFSQAVGQATHSDPSKVKVVGALPAQAGVVQVLFEAPKKVADDATDEAADPDSALANGPLQMFLVAKSTSMEDKEEADAGEVSGPSIDVNAAMPFGDLEPFGREDTAQELTEQSISESNEMVDQLERAEVAEEKRAVFRALTRLRGAAITSFDGIARSQTGNIDEYNKVNKWRKTHPLHHLADEESDVSRWAFPSNADF